jgi:protein associated with RNAse G/E
MDYFLLSELNAKFKEFKKTYYGKIKEFDCVLAEKKTDEVVIVYKISAPLRFLEVDLPSGVRSFGYYWARRNYNVYHWVSEDNKTIVFYFNVSRSTEILDDRVYWQDMIVDIALFSDGKMEVLDEEEIPPDMNSEDRRLIEKTKKEILSNAKEITAELEKRTLSLAQKFPNL